MPRVTASRWRKVIAGLLGLIAIAGLAAIALYTFDMRRAYDRVSARGIVIPSSVGDIEYVEGGSGPPVLVVHGSGGGWDQGELLAEAAVGDGFRWIAPSRFGYLRSTFRPGATFDDQAHAYGALLDHLGLRKVAVVALSHGGPSALLFAVLEPERVSSLTLISAGVASSTEAAQASASRKGDTLVTVFRYDALYWLVSRGFRSSLMSLMGAPRAVAASLSPAQRDLVDRLIDDMNPVSLRAAGAAFDNRAAMPNERIAAIRAPTLIVHARDDTLQLYRNAAYAAATISGATLVTFERGGHLVLAVERTAIRERVRQHLLDHVRD